MPRKSLEDRLCEALLSHSSKDNDQFDEYVEDIKDLMGSSGVLEEGKKITVTTIIDTDEDEEKIDPQVKLNIPDEAKNNFMNKAQELGNFDSPAWVEQVVNGLKQAGVQGMNPIEDDEKPVTKKEIMYLISMLIDLIKTGKV